MSNIIYPGDIMIMVFEDIKSLGKFFAAHSRHFLYKKALIKYTSIPEDIVDNITLLMYDPELLE